MRKMNLFYEWHKYRKEHDHSFNLPIFRAFYRMCRRGDFLTCGRNPGTFREPVYILKEKVGFTDWITETVDEKIEELEKFHEAKEIVET